MLSVVVMQTAPAVIPGGECRGVPPPPVTYHTVSLYERSYLNHTLLILPAPSPLMWCRTICFAIPPYDSGRLSCRLSGGGIYRQEINHTLSISLAYPHHALCPPGYTQGNAVGRHYHAVLRRRIVAEDNGAFEGCHSSTIIKKTSLQSVRAIIEMARR